MNVFIVTGFYVVVGVVLGFVLGKKFLDFDPFNKKGGK